MNRNDVIEVLNSCAESVKGNNDVELWRQGKYFQQQRYSRAYRVVL